MNSSSMMGNMGEISKIYVVFFPQRLHGSSDNLGIKWSRETAWLCLSVKSNTTPLSFPPWYGSKTIWSFPTTLGMTCNHCCNFCSNISTSDAGVSTWGTAHDTSEGDCLMFYFVYFRNNDFFCTYCKWQIICRWSSWVFVFLYRHFSYLKRNTLL